MTKRKQVLTRAYVAMRARPGESWDDARERLGNETAERVLAHVGCPKCGLQAEDLARSGVSLERCLAALPPWPSTVLDVEYLDELTTARSAWQRTQDSLLSRASTIVRSSTDYFGFAMAKTYLEAVRDAGFADEDKYPELIERLEHLMAVSHNNERTTVMAAYRDASWLPRPDVSSVKKAHVLREDGTPMCGLRAVMCDPEPAFTVGALHRCGRQGCKNAWPITDGKEKCGE